MRKYLEMVVRLILALEKDYHNQLMKYAGWNSDDNGLNSLIIAIIEGTDSEEYQAYLKSKEDCSSRANTLTQQNLEAHHDEEYKASVVSSRFSRFSLPYVEEKAKTVYDYILDRSEYVNKENQVSFNKVFNSIIDLIPIYDIK